MAKDVIKILRHYYNQPSAELRIRYLFLGGFIGLLAGLVAIFFHESIHVTSALLLGARDDLPFWEAVQEVPHWRRVVTPVVAGLCVAYMTRWFAPESQGHGVPEIMNAVATRGGVIKPSVAATKFIASVLSISSGHSVGREGPTALIGAVVGSVVGQRLKVSRRRLKMVVGCGTAAGIAATFNAPLAATAFSLELVVGNFNLNSFSPIVFSAMMATVVSRAYFGNQHALFSEVSFSGISLMDITLYSFLGVLMGLVGVFFTKLLYKSEEISEKSSVPLWGKVIFSGLVMGAILILFPYLAGPATWDAIQLTIGPSKETSLMFLFLAVALFKMLATSLSLSTGASGGLFAPSLLVGGALGAPFGMLVNRFFPGESHQPASYALVAMGALVGAITQAPLTAITIIFELTNNYEVILPLICAVACSMAVYNRFMEGSIYTLKLLRRGINLQWGRDAGVLQSISVKEVMKEEEEYFLETSSLSKVLQHFKASSRSTIPVVSAKKELLGIISLSDISENLRKECEQGEHKYILADFLKPDVVTVQAEESLFEAFSKITGGDFQYLPVINNESERRLVGRMHRQHVLQAYRNQLQLRGIYETSQ